MQARRQMEQTPQMAAQRESLGELISDLASQSASLVRDEVSLAKQELREKLGTFKAAAMVIACGAVTALIASLVLCAALILVLSLYVEPWAAALIVGGALAVTAGVILAVGVSHLKRTNLKPEQTLETLEENKEWLKEIT
ncbi:MAG TPA: phage holin family protein [Blastocatellia bacterium]|nr:phage holin family protein [Blastocatellia bacterium]